MKYCTKMLFTFFLVLAGIQDGFSQGNGEPARFGSLLGGGYRINTLGTSVVPDDTQPDVTVKYIVGYNESSLEIYQADSFQQRKGSPVFELSVPNEIKIVCASFKTDDPTKLIVLYSDGVVDLIEFGKAQPTDTKRMWLDPKMISSVKNVAGGQVMEIIGDALYITTNYSVLVSRDTAKTWQMDTTGIGGTFINDIAVDTSNYAWLATSDGVYYQHPDSNIWHRSENFPSFVYCQAIFADRKGRIFVSSVSAIYVSTNGGASWENITGDIFDIVKSFSDDAFDHVYAATTGGAYRLTAATLPWKKISDSIDVKSAIQPASGLVNAISGDSVLYASTSFGIFESTDFGDSWEYLPLELQLRAYQFYGFVRSGGYDIVSTALGLFRIKIGDTVVTKIYPKEGFAGEITLVTDTTGAIYALAPVNETPSSSVMYNMKSTDHGETWFPDTLGAKQLKIAFTNVRYIVDAQGRQFVNGTRKLFLKNPGEPWKMDTVGLHIGSIEGISSVSNNNKDTIFVVKSSGSSFKIFKRGINDSSWTAVDVSSIAATGARIMNNPSGNLLLFTTNGKIYLYSNSSWIQLSTPPGLTPPLFIDQTAFDAKGRLWMSFFSGFDFALKGLYYVSDSTGEWKYAGLDGVGIAVLAALGDTMYAATYVNGVYQFTGSPTTNREYDPAGVAFSFALSQNYPNPFNPSTTIDFSIPVSGFVWLKIYDILGREVATLVNEERKAGMHTVQFDASRLSTGVYIYALKAGNFVASKKLLLMK